MDWNDLRYFLAVARLHSLTEAARELRVSQSTIARRITALEQSLDATLFTKRPDGYSLTASGQALLDPAEQAEAQLLLLERSAARPSDDIAGVVRLAMPELLGQEFIVPTLEPFCRKHGSIQLEVLADVRAQSLVRRDADVLVRLVRPLQGDHIVRRVCSIKLALYGSSSYIENHGVPSNISDLANHQLIGWNRDVGYLPFYNWLTDAAGVASHFCLRTHTMSAQLAAVQSNIGLAVLPGFIGRKYGLIRVLTAHEPFTSDVWLLQAATSHTFARVRAVSDHIADVLTKGADELNDVG